jgi:hypothetical protein
MLRWTPDKDPVDSDFYGIRVDEKWVNENPIAAATMTAPAESGLTIGEPMIDGNIVRSLFSGGVVGTHKIEITLNSAGRVRQVSVYLVVIEK